MKPRRAKAALTLATLLSAAMPATGQCLAQPLTAAPKQINIRSASVLEGLLELGRLTSVCFGIEVSDERLATTAVAWTEGRPVGSLIAPVVSGVGGYTVRVRDRILSVSPARPSSATWLDVKIPRFKAPRADVQSLSNLLFMGLRTVEDPTIAGFYGSYRPGAVNDQAGPFDERDRTVRELLDLIVGSSMGGLWITVGPHARTQPLSAQPFWVILQYAEPPATGTSLMQGIEQRIRSAFGPPRRK